MLVVYRTIRSLRGGCIYKLDDSILSSSTHLILARHEWLPEDDVLTSKHVRENHM